MIGSKLIMDKALNRSSFALNTFSFEYFAIILRLSRRDMLEKNTKVVISA